VRKTLPQKKEGGFIEFDSLINLKPAQGDRLRGKKFRASKKIREIGEKLIKG